MIKIFSYILTFSISYSLLLQLIFMENFLTMSLFIYNILLLLPLLSITFYYLFIYNIQSLSLASHITLGRLVITSLLLSTTILSYIYETIFIENNSIIILSLICLILDGFDGYFARLLRSSSSFGELFDQEVDNFMMLTLATSLYLNINISPIIFLIPFCRYVFIFSSYFIKWLNRDLPFSWRRKYICGGVIFVMILSHLNFLSFFFVSIMSIISILIIIISFVYDVILLYGRKDYA